MCKFPVVHNGKKHNFCTYDPTGFFSEIAHSYPPFYGYQYSETMGCHQKSPTDYYGDINYDEFPNGSDIMGVHMASKSSKKVTFEFVLKLLSFSSDI